MKYLLGFLFGVLVASTYSSWAECCGGFNVPYDTQLEIERAQAFHDALTVPSYASTAPELRLPCGYGDRR